MKNRLIALAASLALTACFSTDKNPSEPQASARKPGQIRLVPMNGLAKAAAAAGGSYDFDLDTARTSFQQYFIVQNVGDAEITDIDLSTDNPNFTFSPSHLSSLPPQAQAGVMQVIKLNVVHGKRLDGLGYADYLAPGLNVATAVFAGATLDESGDTVAVRDSLTVKTFAKVARFDVMAQGLAYPLDGLQYGTTFGGPFATGGVHHYSVPIDTALNPGGLISIKNTGNTPLVVRRWTPRTFAPLSDLVLPVDSSFSFTSLVVELDANGVTFAPSDLPVASNGRVAFILYPQ